MALGVIGRAADQRLLEREARNGEDIEHTPRLGCNFRTDPVSGQHRNKHQSILSSLKSGGTHMARRALTQPLFSAAPPAARAPRTHRHGARSGEIARRSAR